MLADWWGPGGTQFGNTRYVRYESWSRRPARKVLQTATMRAEGLEPPRAFAHRLLRPACLPIPPRPRACRGPRLYGGRAMASIPGRQSGDRASAGVIVTHPNRDKPVVQATRATVIVLLLASAALVLIVTVGGWSVLQGSRAGADRLRARVSHARVLRRALEPRRAAGLRRARRAAADLRARRRPGLVRARQKRLRSPNWAPGCSACSRC